MRIFFAVCFALLTSSAFAHTDVGSTSGFIHGLSHPISGIDHILAMVAVGIFAANLGGGAIWAVPLSFITLMAVGGVLGISGVPVPFVELGIAFSIIVLGLAVAAAITLVGLFASFHGHAHGTEMPVDATGAEYAAGFVIATGLLHLIGIGIGLGIARAAMTMANGRRITQIGGGVIAVLGVGALVGIV